MYSENESVEFLHARIVAGPDHVTEALALSADADVIERRRLISSRATGPIELSTSWFPASIAEAAPRLLELERIRGGTARYVAEMSGRTAAYARDQVCARLSNAQEQRGLQIGRPSAVLIHWLVLFDLDDTPLQFDEAVHPQAHWSFRQEYPLA